MPMTLLAELFERLEAAPEEEDQRQAVARVGVVEIAATATAINDYRASHDASPTTTTAVPPPIPAPAVERPAEARRNAWTITRGGKPICTMVGEPSTRTEALAEARWRWPDADILES
nr:hypothetical protein [Azotobacter beijerinckii]